MTVKVHSGLCMKYSRWDIYNVTCCGVSMLLEKYSRSVFTIPVVAEKMS